MFPQGVLVPPENFQVNQTAQDWVTFGQFVPLTAMLAWTVWFIVKRSDPIPLLCMAGGGVAMLVEPNIDVLAGCWLGDADHGQRTMFDTLGHSFPLWGVACIWYYGGQAFLVYWLLGRTAPGRPMSFAILCAWLASQLVPSAGTGRSIVRHPAAVPAAGRQP